MGQQTIRQRKKLKMTLAHHAQRNPKDRAEKTAASKPTSKMTSNKKIKDSNFNQIFKKLDLNGRLKVYAQWQVGTCSKHFYSKISLSKAKLKKSVEQKFKQN